MSVEDLKPMDEKTTAGKESVMDVLPYEDVEAGPEPRRPVLLAPIYNGLAVGVSICESFCTEWSPRGTRSC